MVPDDGERTKLYSVRPTAKRFVLSATPRNSAQSRNWFRLASQPSVVHNLIVNLTTKDEPTLAEQIQTLQFELQHVRKQVEKLAEENAELLKKVAALPAVAKSVISRAAPTTPR